MTINPFTLTAREVNPLENFLNTTHDHLIEPLKRNQTKLSWKRELKESKRFREASAKIDVLFDVYLTLKNNEIYGETVWDILRKFQANREATKMTQFIDMERFTSPLESEELQAALEPYRALLAPVKDIQRLQLAMLNLAKLQKMPLPYDEITATLAQVTEHANTLPETLLGYVSAMSANLAQAA